MKKSEVYRWRVDPELKRAVEEEARAKGTSVARLLDRIAAEWIAEETSSGTEADVQRRLHEDAARTLGRLRGGDPHRSAQVRRRLRARPAV